MRAIKRKKRFETADVANSVLKQLHEEYPETSVPGLHKLHLIVYERSKKKGVPPVQKYILDIRSHEKDGFYIHYERQEEARKPEPKEQKGYFTEMVEQKRLKKKKTDPRQKKPKIATTRKPPTPPQPKPTE